MYKFKTTPFRHQAEAFEATKDRHTFAFFWEQGTGKTKPVIDTTCHLAMQGKLDGLFVVAPSGVHRNWITDEIPAHAPEMFKAGGLFFETQHGKTQTFARKFGKLIKYQGLPVFTMTYDAIKTEVGKKYAKAFLTERRCMFAADESHIIKTPGSEVTRTVLTAKKFAEYRRLLTGTPVANSPLDIFSQMKFVEPNIWANERVDNFHIFKNRYAKMRRLEVKATGHKFNKIVGYQRLNELKGIIDPYSSRVLKDDVLDLPPKLFSKRYVEMTPQMVQVYNQLVEELLAELDSGVVIEAPLALVRLLRLQQCLSGFLVDEEGNYHNIPGRNARLDTLLEMLEEINHKTIIWARFRRDIDFIMDALGDRAVRYDGQVTADEAHAAKERFQRGDAQFFVGNPAKGATGLTLHAARNVIYYSNSFKLTERLQSEDRAHRIGQEHPVSYYDFIVPGTVDAKIVQALRNKLNVASLVTGDTIRDWI